MIKTISMQFKPKKNIIKESIYNYLVYKKLNIPPQLMRRYIILSYPLYQADNKSNKVLQETILNLIKNNHKNLLYFLQNLKKEWKEVIWNYQYLKTILKILTPFMNKLKKITQPVEDKVDQE